MFSSFFGWGSSESHEGFCMKQQHCIHEPIIFDNFQVISQSVLSLLWNYSPVYTGRLNRFRIRINLNRIRVNALIRIVNRFTQPTSGCGLNPGWNRINFEGGTCKQLVRFLSGLSISAAWRKLSVFMTSSPAHQPQNRKLWEKIHELSWLHSCLCGHF